MSDQDLMAKLAQHVAEHLRASLPPGNAPPLQTPTFGLPAQTPAPFGLPAPVPTGQLPQPVGVSVPVTVPLPDGRELSVRVHFGPEAAANLQALAAACAATFGQYLQARAPYRGTWGHSGYDRPYNGRYGRR